MRKPTLTFDAILAALLATGVAACSRGERAAPEALPPPAAQPPAAVAPAPTAAAAPAPVVGAADAGAPERKGSVQHACGAGSCSADNRKKGGK
jgi:hypothetical protein